MLELTLRLVVSLAVVLGLLLLIAKFAGRRMKGGANAMVQVVHRQALSRTTSVAVVAIGSRVLVLGATENQVSILTELDPHEIDAADIDMAELELHGMDTLTAGAAPRLTAESSLPAAAANSEPVGPRLAAPHPNRPQARLAQRTEAETDLAPTPRIRPAARQAPIPTAVAGIVPVTSPAEQILASEPIDQDSIAIAPLPVEEPVPPIPPALAALAALSDAQQRLGITEPGTSAPLTPDHGALAGSVLSPQTWKQALAAVSRTTKKAS